MHFAVVLIKRNRNGLRRELIYKDNCKFQNRLKKGRFKK